MRNSKGRGPLRRGAAFALLGLALLCPLAARTAADVPPASPKAHNLVAIEFRDWPPSELGVSGGFLGVPDSSGRFPADFQRWDKGTGRTAPPGTGAGNLLVFTDLEPGTYRVGLFLLEETKMFRKLLASKMPTTEDRCLVYGDTTAALTFQVKDGDLLYLGCVVRRMRAAVDSTDVWGSRNQWNPGNEAKAWKALSKRKEFAAWRDLLQRRAAALEAEAKRKS